MFDPKHLAGASLELGQSMVKVGRKAAELERVKLHNRDNQGKKRTQTKTTREPSKDGK